MALGNPIYVDEQALHTAQAIRLLAYGAVDGQQGVMASSHCAVQALGTPAGAIQVLPGGYSVLAKHLGGAYEAYVGKFSVAEQVSVSPVGSSGARTDLVILRIENPYVSGAGSWEIPVDPVAGPYAYLRVIEGASAYTQDVAAYNNTWSAITLARIDRPANTGIVQQSHVTDLRSLADLRGQRITIVNNPPPTPPPVAYPLWTGVVECHANSTHLKTQTTFHDWPSEVNFTVPVPSWATTADVLVLVNPEIDGNVYGDLRLTLDGTVVDAPPCIYNYNYARTVGPEQYTTAVAGAITIPSGVAGRSVPLRVQARSLANDSGHPGKLSTHAGCFVTAQINFKRSVS